MTAITRTRLGCNDRDCPHPNDEDFHRPVCRSIEVEHSREAQHQHWPKRSQGGKTVVAVICSYCHDKIDNGPWGNAVENGAYRIWDHRGTTLLRVPQSTGEDAGSEPPSETAISPVVSGVVERGHDTPGSSAAMAGEAQTMTQPQSTPGTPPSLDSWARRGQELLLACKRMERLAVTLAFEVGDWVNEGEDRFGEMASQFVDAFSYWQVAKWASVARRIPAACRVYNVEGVTMEHHRVVADQPEDLQRPLLLRAAEKHWRAAELKREMQGRTR